MQTRTDSQGRKIHYPDDASGARSMAEVAKEAFGPDAQLSFANSDDAGPWSDTHEVVGYVSANARAPRVPVCLPKNRPGR